MRKSKFHEDILIKDFIEILKGLENLYNKTPGISPKLPSFLRKLRNNLLKYRELNGDQFIIYVESMHFDEIKDKKEKKNLEIDIENIKLKELRGFLDTTSLTKEQLLQIGETRFGISKGAHRKLTKENLLKLIGNAMENVEALEIIQKKASD